ncbi:hypothetical protein AB4084_37185, partial [Lysobacter sp. 2RAB21]
MVPRSMALTAGMAGVGEGQHIAVAAVQRKPMKCVSAMGSVSRQCRRYSSALSRRIRRRRRWILCG